MRALVPISINTYRYKWFNGLLQYEIFIEAPFLDEVLHASLFILGMRTIGDKERLCMCL